MDVRFAAWLHVHSQAFPGLLVDAFWPAAMHAPHAPSFALFQWVLWLPDLTVGSTPVGPPKGVERLVLHWGEIVQAFPFCCLLGQSICLLIPSHPYVCFDFANEEVVPQLDPVQEPFSDMLDHESMWVKGKGIGSEQGSVHLPEAGGTVC